MVPPPLALPREVKEELLVDYDRADFGVIHRWNECDNDLAAGVRIEREAALYSLEGCTGCCEDIEGRQFGSTVGSDVEYALACGCPVVLFEVQGH